MNEPAPTTKKTPRKFSYTELAAEAKREIQMREYVYTKKGHRNPLDEKRIEMMEAIYDHFQKLAEKEKLPGMG